MQIFLKSPTGKSFSLEVNPSDTIGSLKSRLVVLISKENSVFFPVSTLERMSLIFEGKKLEDSDTFISRKIDKEATINYQFRMGQLDPYKELINKISLNLFRNEVNLTPEERELIKNKNATIDDYMVFAESHPDSNIANKLVKNNVIMRKSDLQTNDQKENKLQQKKITSLDSQNSEIISSIEKVNRSWKDAIWGYFFEDCEKAQENRRDRVIHVVLVPFQFLSTIFSQISSLFKKLFRGPLEENN